MQGLLKNTQKSHTVQKNSIYSVKKKKYQEKEILKEKRHFANDFNEYLKYEHNTKGEPKNETEPEEDISKWK